MSRIPITPNPYQIYPNYEFNRLGPSTQHQPKTPAVEQHPKNTTPVRFRMVNPNEYASTPSGLSHKPSVDLMHSPIGRANKENIDTQFYLQPSPSKLTIKSKPGNMTEFVNNNLNKMHAPQPSLKQQNSGMQFGQRDENQKRNSNFGLTINKSPVKEQEKKMKTQAIEDIIKNCDKQKVNLRRSNSKTQMAFGSSKLRESKQENKLFSNGLNRIDSKQNFKNLGVKESQELSKPAKTAMCMNNDGRRAKYRVNGDEEDEQDEEPMFCCSKCAIKLMSQGFKFTQIQSQQQQSVSITKPLNKRQREVNQLLESAKQLNKKLQSKREKIRKTKQNNGKQYQPQLNMIDDYYNSLISMLEELRVRDRDTVLHYRNNSEKDLDSLDKQVSEAIEKINQIQQQIPPSMESIKNEISNEEYSVLIKNFNEQLRQNGKLVDVAEKLKQKEVLLDQNLENKFHEFNQLIVTEFSVKITKKQIPLVSPKNVPYENSRMLQSKGNQNKLTNYFSNHIQEIQQERQESYQIVPDQVKKPFRNLFADESDEAEMQICQEKLDFNNQYSNQQQTQQEACSPSFKNI